MFGGPGGIPYTCKWLSKMNQPHFDIS
jgi:hypothetical protein